MRVHRDTGYYYIGSTSKTVIKRHADDVIKARGDRCLSCSIVGFIWGILLRDGDPFEEFDLITIGEYETRKEAYDAEGELIRKYHQNRGDRDSGLLINTHTCSNRIECRYDINKNLVGYAVVGPEKTFLASFTKKHFSLEQLKKFAEEFLETSEIPEEYNLTKNTRVLSKYLNEQLIGYRVVRPGTSNSVSFSNTKFSLEQLKEFAEEFAETNIMPEECAKVRRAPKHCSAI